MISEFTRQDQLHDGIWQYPRKHGCTYCCNRLATRALLGLWPMRKVERRLAACAIGQLTSSKIAKIMEKRYGVSAR
jgi:ribosomal protein L37AE/L43A